ncbi:hypothetical protein GCM10020331_008200 [Ectobacillus funiculus]
MYSKKVFHGRTLGALHFTRQEGVYQNFPRTSIPVYEVERENLKELERTILKEDPIAIMLEPILGSGGIYPLSGGIFKKVLKSFVDSIICYLLLTRCKVV